MAINGINANDPISLGVSSSTGDGALGRDAFMSLLVQQMRNQDPLAPMDNQQFIAQLAQFSSLEQMQKVNDNLLGLAVLQQSNALMSQLTQSSALIGRSVRYVDPTTEETLTGTVTTVKLQDGLAVLNIDGEDIPLGNVTEVLGAEAPPDDAGGDDAGADGGDTPGGDGS
jgi:flagellar basal-body rod modification protein FlgD